MTWPLLTKRASSSASTMARLSLRRLLSGHLKRICPLRSSGTAMNSRPNNAIAVPSSRRPTRLHGPTNATPPACPMGVRSLVTVTDPFAVLGVAPDASRRDVQAARRALVKRLHPDVRVEDDPKVPAHAARRLAEVNAAYDAVVTGWLSSAGPGPPSAHPP